MGISTGISSEVSLMLLFFASVGFLILGYFIY